jgi:uncharacterized membrane protein
MLFGFFMVWMASLGGGIWEQGGYWGFQWQHLIFSGLCHQIADRSIWVAGQPMAVCARCFGIYSSLFISWIFVPRFSKASKLSMKFVSVIGGVILAINVLDVAASIAGVWDNTSAARIILGGAIGTTIVLFLINKQQ